MQAMERIKARKYSEAINMIEKRVCTRLTLASGCRMMPTLIRARNFSRGLMSGRIEETRQGQDRLRQGDLARAMACGNRNVDHSVGYAQNWSS